jgi:Mce-associated membrane protein
MEGDAGTSRLNLADQQDPEHPEPHAEEAVEHSSEQDVEHSGEPDIGHSGEPESERRPSRLGRGAMAAICAGLLVLTALAGTGGYLALRSHTESEQIARDEASALQAAKDCVTATQAPDTAAMTAAQTKIIECSTGDFGAQSVLYSSMLMEAYQAANVKVQVSDLRAAVEKHNDDGSMDLLVAVRVVVSNTEKSNEEQGYRLRVKMALDDGVYKVARLDQVTS